jgi:hypothetical protein
MTGTQLGLSFTKPSEQCPRGFLGIIGQDLSVFESIRLHIAITLFRAITVFCRTDIILQIIPHIHIECEEYSTE